MRRLAELSDASLAAYLAAMFDAGRSPASASLVVVPVSGGHRPTPALPALPTVATPSTDYAMRRSSPPPPMPCSGCRSLPRGASATSRAQTTTRPPSPCAVPRRTRKAKARCCTSAPRRRRSPSAAAISRAVGSLSHGHDTLSVLVRFDGRDGRGREPERLADAARRPRRLRPGTVTHQPRTCLQGVRRCEGRAGSLRSQAVLASAARGERHGKRLNGKSPWACSRTQEVAATESVS